MAGALFLSFPGTVTVDEGENNDEDEDDPGEGVGKDADLRKAEGAVEDAVPKAAAAAEEEEALVSAGEMELSLICFNPSR
mmetsp:Transcript_20868/g.41351  ORF Transcript_20868/g.41351 Transcript_20868/m.41351 type:complete len:80 (+) Transcript_20868:710-949(+)